MNIRLLLRGRIGRWDGHFRRGKLIDRVWRMRCIRLGRLFDHASSDATRLPVKRIVID